MAVKANDANRVLASILHTFNIYVCPGHESEAGEHMGETVHCDGMCQWDTTRKPSRSKTWAEMDATPTLYDYCQCEVSRGNWSIAWEGDAPEGWTSSEKLAENVRKATDGRVHVEPINNCILGVYPS
jgi:hypothetical protein